MLSFLYSPTVEGLPFLTPSFLIGKVPKEICNKLCILTLSKSMYLLILFTLVLMSVACRIIVFGAHV